MSSILFAVFLFFLLLLYILLLLLCAFFTFVAVAGAFYLVVCGVVGLVLSFVPHPVAQAAAGFFAACAAVSLVVLVVGVVGAAVTGCGATIVWAIYNRLA